jgi:hypothetical protein
MGVCVENRWEQPKERSKDMSASSISGIKNGLALQISLKETLEAMFEDPSDPDGNSVLGDKIVTSVICQKLAAKAVGAPDK